VAIAKLDAVDHKLLTLERKESNMPVESLWLALHLMFLIGFRNRLAFLFQDIVGELVWREM